MQTFAQLLRELVAGVDLSPQQTDEMIGSVMDGAYTTAQGAGLLVALAAKGETIDEVFGAARAMRERSLHVEHELPAVLDIVGTGGDGANTINISTMAALVLAAAGVPVAKHGNRAASSACGSADVLEVTGLPLDIAPDRAGVMLRDAHFAFLFAPRYHPAMKNVAPIRRELGIRTVFNVLGPLTNPARANVAVVGVARPELAAPVADVLRRLGVDRGAVVHATNGIDEVAGDVDTDVISFDGNGVRRWVLHPADLGVDAGHDAIAGGSIERCRDAFNAILSGERSARSDVVALNAGLALQVFGIAASLRDGVEQARAILHAGEGMRTYERAKVLATAP